MSKVHRNNANRSMNKGDFQTAIEEYTKAIVFVIFNFKKIALLRCAMIVTRNIIRIELFVTRI